MRWHYWKSDAMSILCFGSSMALLIAGCLHDNISDRDRSVRDTAPGFAYNTMDGSRIRDDSRAKNEFSSFSPPMRKPESKLVDSAKLMDRESRLRARGVVDLGNLAVPGYYTWIQFSASWCEPCHILWDEARSHVTSKSNLVIVDIDIGDDKSGLLEFGNGMLTELGFSGKPLPVAVLMGPIRDTKDKCYGLISCKEVLSGLDTRTYKEPLSILPLLLTTER